MKLSDKLIEVINDQINKELYSAYLYRSMALETNDRALDGITSWLKLQTQEEIEHAEEMIAYLEHRGVRPELRPIDKVPAGFGSVKEILTQALHHEEYVTKSIEAIVRLAEEEGDFGARIFFDKFIVEQEEEEDNANHNLQRLDLIGEDNLAMFDAEMAQRGKGCK